ncbi:hypothetical protein ES703_51832 [subsurface metagenome]
MVIGLGMVLINIGGFLQQVLCLDIFFLLLEKQGKMIVGIGVVWVQFDGTKVIGSGLLIVLLLMEKESQMVMSLYVIIFQLHSLLEVLPGLLDITLVLQQNGQMKMSLAVVGVQLNGFFQMCSGVAYDALLCRYYLLVKTQTPSHSPSGGLAIKCSQRSIYICEHLSSGFPANASLNSLIASSHRPSL